MILEAEEFLRRFLNHVLSNGFVKIRSYGYLSNPTQSSKLGIK